jgi:hypothetical protein
MNCTLDSFFPYTLSTETTVEWHLLIVHLLPTTFTILFYLACECSKRKRFTTGQKLQSTFLGGLAFGVVGIIGYRAVERLNCSDNILDDTMTLVWQIIALALALGFFGLHFAILNKRVPRLNIVLALVFAAATIVLEFGLRGWWTTDIVSVVELLIPLQQAFCIAAVCLIAWLPASRAIITTSSRDIKVFEEKKSTELQNRRTTSILHTDPLNKSSDTCPQPATKTSAFW